MFELAIILAPTAAVFGWVAWDLHRSSRAREKPVSVPTVVIVEGDEVAPAPARILAA